MKLANVALQALLRVTGKTYRPPEDLPSALIAQEVARRAAWLVRGVARTGRPVFVGRGVRLRGKASIKLGRFATLDGSCTVDGFARSGVTIGDRTRIGAHTIISCTSHLSTVGEGLAIGRDCGVSEFCYFGAAGGIEIGDDVIMGQYVSFHSQNHIFDDSARPIRTQGVTSRGIVVGNDVWIGAKATILDGARIGNRTVIAAGAVVTGEFPANVILGGIPAKVLREI